MMCQIIVIFAYTIPYYKHDLFWGPRQMCIISMSPFINNVILYDF